VAWVDGEDGALTCWLSVGGSIRATASVQTIEPQGEGATS
jgi:hypothetical protein